MPDIVEAPLLGITPWACYHGKRRLISHESVRRYAGLILRNSGAS